MKIPRYVIILFITRLAFAESEAEGSCPSDESCPSSAKLNVKQCDLFLAPSTIPGAGLGMFVGSSKVVGESVGPGDVAIPIVDISWHNGRTNSGFYNMFTDYQWHGKAMGMQQESDDLDGGVKAHSPGLDSAINCHLGLINVERAYPEYDTKIKRYTNPGAGAITPYFNGTSRVNADIPAGGELFKFYGNSYFTTRRDIYGVIPLIEDYPVAEEVCKTWSGLNEVSEDMKEAVWNHFIPELPWQTHSAMALPKSSQDARQVAHGGIRSLYQPRATRPVEELRRIGRCQDSIRHAPSTIPFAGRGAFATRELDKGEIISGAPLLHIPLRETTFMFDLNETSGKRNPNKRTGTQLLVNYCFGHVDSTLLLCPYSAGVNYINHNQTLSNVKIQWSPHGTMAHNESWLELTPHDMLEYFEVNLGIDYVATRDIREGEELFLNYGDAFEKAWQEHLHNWRRDAKWKHYASAAVWNKHMAEMPLRTMNEQQYDPYPDHILLRCTKRLNALNYEELIQDSKDKLWNIKTKGMDCDILRRYWNQSELVYEVRITQESENNSVRRNVPRYAFQFVDEVYSTDIHMNKAFRFSAQLPEEMVPRAWRNDVGEKL
jgi:hypothetical protein